MFVVLLLFFGLLMLTFLFLLFLFFARILGHSAGGVHTLGWAAAAAAGSAVAQGGR